MNLSNITLREWQNNEVRLKRFLSYIEFRIEELEFRRIEKPSLLGELKGGLYYAEEILKLSLNYIIEIKKNTATAKDSNEYERIINISPKTAETNLEDHSDIPNNLYDCDTRKVCGQALS